jgi:hypothetical protein
MKEVFYVLSVKVEKHSAFTTVIIMPMVETNPTEYKSYKEAEDWIKIFGTKNQHYQIQKFLIPIRDENEKNHH